MVPGTAAPARWVTTGAVAAALLLSGCSGNGSELTDPVADASSAVAQAATGSDAVVIAQLGVQADEWNEVLSPVMAGYDDPKNIDRTLWVEEARRLLLDLQPRIREMGRRSTQVADPEARALSTQVVTTYRDELRALAALVHAVSAGDRAAQDAARADLQKASKEADRLAPRLAAAG